MTALYALIVGALDLSGRLLLTATLCALLLVLWAIARDTLTTRYLESEDLL